MNKTTLIGPISSLITLEDLPIKGALSDSQLRSVSDAGLLINDGSVKKVDHFDSLRNEAEEIVEIEGEMVGLPGFIDAHTHICFGGSRAHDYAMRNSGKTYLEIAKAGGGIWDTVTQTRESNENELIEGIEKRANRHLSEGVTTIEVKSGYGLSIKQELKMLRAIRLAQHSINADLIPTCLAAHVLPRDFNGNHEEYLNHISADLFPILIEEQLTKRVDAFIEEEAFSPTMSEAYFKKAQSLGFDVTIHADQFSTGGSEVAVNIGAISADHLEASGEQEISMLAKSDTIATALPGASMGLGVAFTPARKLLDQGASVAIASDWNPGSAPMGDLLMQASVLGAYEKLSNAEILSGITFRAAAALGMNDRGRLKAGHLADFQLYQTEDFNEVFYHQGKLKPAMVFKKGQLVNSN